MTNQGPALPEALLSLARRGPFIVELAAGNRFAAALQFAHAVPGLKVRVTDVAPKVREAPPPLEAHLDDLWEPNLDLYRGAALLYAIRIPEELQAPAARLARTVGAPLALLPLKDEWADLTPLLGAARLLPGGWRLHGAP
ncbi:MAG TPA: UPF0146 family protein [Candidatus Thermoplasmatota archaeon]|nr:UPF0146 family protein [Candidatus Thermoplasmatota archaeon]